MTFLLVALGVIALWVIMLLALFRLLVAWAEWRHPLPLLDDLEIAEHGRPLADVHRLDDYRRSA